MADRLDHVPPFSPSLPDTERPVPESLALSAREAAKALGIGARTLWVITNRNEIPHVRIGRRVLYPRAALVDWLAERSRKGARR